LSGAQAKIGRREGARGSGNRTKRLRLFLEGGETETAAALTKRLARGEGFSLVGQRDPAPRARREGRRL
jgi:hypothetical protein